MKADIAYSFQNMGKQQTQKSRTANWLMRLYAKPNFEKVVEQVTQHILTQK